MFFQLDPNDKFLPTGVRKQSLIDACGVLPMFFHKCEQQGAETQEEILECIKAQYGFPVVPMEGGEVGADGVYRFPEDPPLHPIMSCTYADWDSHVQFLVYQHAIVAIRTEGATLVTRLD